MSETIDSIIRRFNLEPIPNEGGWFARTYTSEEELNGRPLSTSIYGLFTPEQFSALHRLDADEVFFYQSGDPFEMLELKLDGTVQEVTIGPDLEAGEVPHHTFGRGTWFGGRPVKKGQFGYSLVSCVVSPGFQYEGFELGEFRAILKKYGEKSKLIRELIRD